MCPCRWATRARMSSLPGDVDRDSPIDPDHVTTSLGNLRKDRGGPCAEMDRRHSVSDRVENPARVGERELAVVGGTENAHPRVEHLHRIDARLDLCAEIVSDYRSEVVAQPMPRRRMAVHQRLGAREVVRVATLDRI